MNNFKSTVQCELAHDIRFSIGCYFVTCPYCATQNIHIPDGNVIQTCKECVKTYRINNGNYHHE